MKITTTIDTYFHFHNSYSSLTLTFIFIFHFIVDHGTGGVTEIRTVAEVTGGSSSSCLPAVNAGSIIEFIPNTYLPAQCSVLSVMTNPPSSIRGFVPSGTPFTIDTQSSKSHRSFPRLFAISLYLFIFIFVSILSSISISVSILVSIWT